MINEIVRKYGSFSDALISDFIYKASFNSPENKGEIEILLKCMNSENDYNWEIIKLIFIGVLSFRVVENEKTSSSVINTALLKVENEIITVDFFPFFYSDSNLKENPNSDFIVKCKMIKYELIEECS